MVFFHLFTYLPEKLVKCRLKSAFYECETNPQLASELLIESLFDKMVLINLNFEFHLVRLD